MTDERHSAKTGTTGTTGKSGTTDGAAVRGVAIWLAIATVVVIGLVLAVRHGGQVTSLLGGTT